MYWAEEQLTALRFAPVASAYDAGARGGRWSNRRTLWTRGCDEFKLVEVRGPGSGTHNPESVCWCRDVTVMSAQSFLSAIQPGPLKYTKANHRAWDASLMAAVKAVRDWGRDT